MASIINSVDVFGVLRHGARLVSIRRVNGETSYILEAESSPNRVVLDQEAFDFFRSLPLNSVVSFGRMPKWARTKYREYLEALENFNQHGLINIISDPKHWIGLTLKIVLGCNFGCKYCYEAQRMEDDIEKMPKKIIRATLKRVTEFGGGSIAIHGGEPGLYPEGIEYTAKLAKKYKERYGARIRVTVQTNGTAVFTAWDILREYDIPVGLSYDGPYHDKYRVFKDGSPTSEYVLKAIKKLQEANHPYMVISVLDRDADFSKVFTDALERKIQSIRMNPMYPVGHPILEDKMMPPTKYIQMMIDGAKKLVEGSETVPKRVREHADPIWGLKPLVCLSIPCQAGINFFDIDVEGKVAVCDSQPNIKIGDVTKNSVWDWMFHPESIGFRARWSEFGKPCESCPYKYYCDGGGCEGFLDQMNWPTDQKGPYCLREFFDYTTKLPIEDQLKIASESVKRIFGGVIDDKEKS